MVGRRNIRGLRRNPPPATPFDPSESAQQAKRTKVSAGKRASSQKLSRPSPKSKKSHAKKSGTYLEVLLANLSTDHTRKGVSTVHLAKELEASMPNYRKNLLLKATVQALELGLAKRTTPYRFSLTPYGRAKLRKGSASAAVRLAKRRHASGENNKEGKAKQRVSKGKRAGAPKGKGKGKTTTTTTKAKRTVARAESVQGKSFPLGTVDKYFSDAANFRVVSDGEGVWDCMLVKQDLSLNMDKYYVIQLLQHLSQSSFVVLMRWGRTGTKGQVKTEKFADESDAKAKFLHQFTEKTGVEWSDACKGTASPSSSMYQILKKSYSPEARAARDERVIWQYYVDDYVDGKSVGWYDYQQEASETVDGIYHEWTSNPSLSVRAVQSGAFCYHVDFNSMTQTNVAHPARKVRRIRRHPLQ